MGFAMLRAITWLSVLYGAALAAVLCLGRTWSLADLIFDVIARAILLLLLASPVIPAYVLAWTFDQPELRIAMLACDVALAIFTAMIFHYVMTGEHDAQYQLVISAVPALGLPGVLLAAAIAGACVRLRAKPSRDADRRG